MTALSILRETLDALASVVFPAPCRVCGETLVTASRVPVCGACLGRLVALDGPMCGRCGRPLTQGAGSGEQGVVHSAERPRAGSPGYAAGGASVRLLCHLCRRGVYAFEVARSFTAYDEHATRAIVLLKHHAIAPLGAWFAARVAEMVRREGITADVVVPVPLHRARHRERGHNQAELIARPLAKMLGLPMSAALLVRTKPRPAAHRLTRKERWTSVRGAYGTREGARVDKQRVLLVDDVFTTGATLDACSRALLDAGASGVIGVTVARVVPQWEPLSPSPASASSGGPA